MKAKRIEISGQMVNPNGLKNKVNKEELKRRLMGEPFKRTTLSMYRYVNIENVEDLRHELFVEWSDLGVFGRIYLAKEGFNAQLSVPENNFEAFKKNLEMRPDFFKDLRLNIAIEDDGKSFYKLDIKVKNKVVADGLNDGAFDTTNVGIHLDAGQWNSMMEEEDVVIVDMRNHYESEVGHFEGAITPDCDTFAEELPMVVDELKSQKDKKVMLYCTGGIRCEKASAYLKSEGFEKVHQLNGGIINYKRQIESQGLPSKFKGKNFVFDDRLSERITDDILSNCHQCELPCDEHTNCLNDDCHLLFIQCDDCAQKYEGCCTPKCMEIAALPEDEQRALRQGEAKDGDCQSVYKSRLRPKLNEILKTF
ncbi:MAG: rhodanese-related sulfurtransferase [Candidatus Peregrinibacteria bacterium]|nr:rhodanese-related sulfurtransferase [Candidatus Peregrinibacteria bacterium]MDZ4245315.1 rhodanese-related sulfurtransferase [Candidatus Gracilibacteria bacterium]